MNDRKGLGKKKLTNPRYQLLNTFLQCPKLFWTCAILTCCTRAYKFMFQAIMYYMHKMPLLMSDQFETLKQQLCYHPSVVNNLIKIFLGGGGEFSCKSLGHIDGLTNILPNRVETFHS